MRRRTMSGSSAHERRLRLRAAGRLGLRAAGRLRLRAAGRLRVASRHVQIKPLDRRSAASVTPRAPSASALIASVLATPCLDTQFAPEPGNLEQVREATLCLINQERARNDELPLRLDARLEQAAQEHSEDMFDEDYFAHVAPNGETPLSRIRATGYIPNAQAGYTIGENIAWGTLYLATPAAITAAWIASPEHLANILDAEYRDTAVGVYPAAPPSLANGQPGAVYTQEFGVIVG